MTLQELVKLVKSKSVHQIRAGDKHRFIDITIISTDNRFFVRQYKFGTKNWRDAFLKEGSGAMKIGDKVVKVNAKIPDDLDTINPKITRTTHKKLPLIYFLMRLTFDTKKHAASTIELIPQVGELV